MPEFAQSAREAALTIYRDAVDAVRADRLITDRLHLTGDILEADHHLFELAQFEHIYVVGAGKASAAMAAAIEPLLGDRLTAGVVVTKEGHSVPTRKIRILEAGHPIPDENSIRAGHAIYDLAAGAGERDLVICLLSGGASALMELPREGVTLEDLSATTDLLMRAGASIFDLNAVRACLSELKAGGLARAAAPARVLCLVLSDVLGNHLELIGSGPCCDISVDPTAAMVALDRFGLWEQTPEQIRQALHSTAPPLSGFRCDRCEHVVLADIWTAIQAAKDSAVRLGLKPAVLTGSLQGEARQAGKWLGEVAKDLSRTSQIDGIDCYIAGGETTVTVYGHGKGGRSQELATAAAIEIAGVRDVALLAAGTDGTDGPTDAAGGLVDGDSIERAWAHGAISEGALKENDTYGFLNSSGDLLKTGPTQTNVGDLVVITRRLVD